MNSLTVSHAATQLRSCSPRFHCRLIILLVFWVAALPASAELFFAAKPTGPASNIYAASARGHITPITSDSRYRDLMADVNPQGDIIFVSDRSIDTGIDLSKQHATFDLFYLAAGKSLPQRLTSSNASELYPKFRPSADAAAYINKDAEREHLKIINLTTGDTRTLVAADTITHFSWSPDGRSIAYAASENGRSVVRTFSPEEPEGRVTLVEQPDPENPPDFTFTYTQWSPGGDKLAYIVSSLRQPERILRIRDLTTGEDTAISAEDLLVQQPIAWHDNNKSLVFSALVNFEFSYDERVHKKKYRGAMHLFMAGDGKTRQLTSGAGLHKNPVFSPDGSTLACLYGDSFDARALSVRLFDLTGEPLREIYAGVTKDSFLHWLKLSGPSN